MDSELKNDCEKALKQLFKNSQLDEVVFGTESSPILLKFKNVDRSDHQPRDVWLNIESKWDIFPPGETHYPDSEDEMRALTKEEVSHIVFPLQREKVVDVRVGETVPHLFLVFQSGQTLFVNGHHRMYECWQAGDGIEHAGDQWLIVATPGDDIAIWAPSE
ncbi:hypothetical protein ACFQPF_15640 [Fictibacillus iocasae]|uniref:Uncharacterized protein n=1 Tax=Fictibacillus iocasae TaxID=2715437 RepID=A0ABW2NVV2_9BACL